MDWIRRLNSTLHQQAQQARLPFRISKAKQVRSNWCDHQPPRRPGTSTCLLDMSHVAADGEQGRRFHALVTLLHRSGYDLWLTPRLSFLQTGHKPFKGWAIQTTRVYDPDSSPERFDLCLSDRHPAHPLADRTLRVSTSLRRGLNADEIPLPYSCYPAVWQNREDDRFEAYREGDRRWRVFFGGYFQQKAYQKIRKYTVRPMINRHDVVHTLIHAYGQRTTRIESDSQLLAMQSRGDDGFVLIDSTRYRLAADEWLGSLANAQFFVAAPGGDYPLCHNCVEALAVGTIPIVQYGSLFHPALSDGKNCLAYESTSDLRRLIDRIDRMAPEQIESLRRGAIEYFEDHLSPKAFRRKIEQSDANGLHVFPYLAKPAAA
ncbi:MAG: hypothetical protein AAFU85_14000 [Planctomycetota bacterium]